MKLLRINEKDNVAVALERLEAGSTENIDGQEVVLKENVDKGHKIALTQLHTGDKIIKYGFPIGHCTQDIQCGEWVHTHNVKTDLSESADYEYHPHTSYIFEVLEKSFMGYRRADGRVGIRNEIWIIPTVGCVNSVAQRLERECQLSADSTVEGVHAFTHPYGCSQMGDDHEQTKKLLTALVRHPNAGGVLVVGLGCENLTQEQFKEELKDWDENRVKFMICQDEDDEIQTGKKLLDELIRYAASFSREEIPASELIVGMKCGGSDGLSGITANPTVGQFSDLLIADGGTTILTEVPEMFGAENILLERCADQTVFDKAVDMINGFKKYYTDHHQVVYENPSPGNKAGGITTLEDKSCGCVQKGGTAIVTDVLHYAEQVTTKGLNLLTGPGNDLVSSTALAASGAHLVLFTTGRGTPFGAPVPTVKISSNSLLKDKKSNWIDFNAGSVADGESIREAGGRLLDYVMKVASGKQTHSEINGYRDLAIFKDGVTL